MYLISSAMDPDQFDCLIMCQTSKQMWDSLLSIHEMQSVSSRLILMQRFHRYTMAPNDTVLQHITNVQKLVRQIKTIKPIKVRVKTCTL